MVREMYERVGYHQERLFCLEVGQGAPPLRPINEEECKSHVVGLVLAQMYSLKKGTEYFGEKVLLDEAMLKELSQIDDFKTYKLLHKKHELSEQDRRDMLEFMIKITEKRVDEEGHRMIKSRMTWWLTGANRDPAYEGYEKSNGSSSTVRTDSVSMTGVIDAHERRNVAIIVVENAFFQSENDQ